MKNNTFIKLKDHRSENITNRVKTGVRMHHII